MPPETAWDRSTVAPSRLEAWWPRTSWPRRIQAVLQRLRAICPPLSTFYLFFVIFVVSTIFHCHRRLGLVPAPWASPSLVVFPARHMPREGMFTIRVKGRLGNQMGEYATLFALARMNGRLAFIPASMHSTLAPIFRISLPVLHSDTAKRIPWQNYHLNDWMEERYRHIPGHYVRFTGYPCSWTFYHHLRPEILKEFTLHDHVREEAQAFLRGLQVNGSQPSTFVGVHVRSGDTVYLANFTQPNSPFHTVFKPEAAYLPEWVGIAADLGQPNTVGSGHASARAPKRHWGALL